MKRIVEFFVKYPVWANTLIGMTLLFGLVSLTDLKRSFFPERDPSRIYINMIYPGASPEEVEDGVTVKIEEAVKNLKDIDEISSTSSENLSNVVITITAAGDIDEILTEVKNAVDRISTFPSDAERPTVFKQQSTQMAAFLNLSGNMSLEKLKITAEEIKDDLLDSRVLSNVNVMGIPSKEIAITASEVNLLKYSIKFDDIESAVRLNNRDISAGSVKSSDEEILIRSRARSTNAEDIGKIILKSYDDGRVLRINDVANVSEQFVDSYEKGLYQGNRSVTFMVNKDQTEDLDKIAKFLKSYTDEFNITHEDAKMKILFSFNDMLDERIDMLVSNGMLGFLMVVLALGLFLNLRLSFWVAAGIPISFLGMFVVMLFMDITINMMTLFAMILIVGILVDDGIVIAENIYSHFEQGKNSFRAAIDGTFEVMPAVFASVLTTVIAFFPLIFVEGSAFMDELAIVVIAALLFSLLEAFFILPAHLASRKVLKPSEKIRFADKFLAFFRDNYYIRLLSVLIKYRWISATIPAVFLMILIGLMGGGFIKSTFFPSVPFDDLAIDIAFKPGEREMQTESYLRKFEKIVWEVNDEFKEKIGSDVISQTSISIGSTRNTGKSGAHCGHVFISLDVEDKPISSFDVQKRLREVVGDVPEIDELAIGGQGRWGKPVSIGLQGKDFKELKSVSEIIKDELRSYNDLKDVSDNLNIGKRELLLTLKPEAYNLGLDHNNITRQIRQGFYGQEIQSFQKGNDEVKVWIRYPEHDRSSLSLLENVKIKTNDGKQYPLSVVADYKIERSVVSIKHLDTNREIRVEADLKDAYTPVPPLLEKIAKEIEPEIKKQYPGVKFNYGGQRKNAQMTQNSLMKLVPLSLLIIFIIIVLSFRSFYQGIIVVAMIPLGIGSAILGHWIEFLPVSILSAMGMLALCGVMINDSIVFMDEFNRSLTKRNMSTIESVINAGKNRFRPILLTSLTTMAGLFPLIRETSFQAQFIIPMAVSMAYGVMFGTVFNLLFLPVLILVFNDIKRTFIWIFTGKMKSKEEVEHAVIEARVLEDRMNRINDIFEH
ncbi:MAG: efflux RND transporter permease subunit [Candidatus Delongbacteria bacterium]|nr:efflux RND transporter permease subunit [Candidatus Delongbacteria bacterium]MBN2835591.1 efflux RND transporter permease subunit [Candidatus Delongbacteria bacterium]